MTAAILPLPQRAPQRLTGHGRGNRTRIVLDMQDALAPCMEGVALAEESAAQFERIVNAAIAGNRMAVVNFASTGQARALRVRDEFRRMAADLEDPDVVA